jgi:predicted Holliday junction resolvase-like endonuclease
MLASPLQSNRGGKLVPGNLSGLALGMAIGVLLSWIYFLQWKYRYTRLIRQDAVQRSQAVTSGKVHEQLIPYLPGFPYNPKDVRFLGSPVDLVVFDGLAEGHLQRIVFVEVKTGSAGLSQRERCIREIVEDGEVDWAELRVTQPLSSGAA